MIHSLPAEVFNRISHYVVQTELIELLVNNGLSGDWDAKYSSDDYSTDTIEYKYAYIDEDEENDEENKEEAQKEEYSRWKHINKWITLDGLHGFVIMDEIKARKVAYIDSSLGFWIGVSSIYKDDIIKELIDIFYNYEVSDEEFKALKEGKDIFPKEKADKE